MKRVPRVVVWLMVAALIVLAVVSVAVHTSAEQTIPITVNAPLQQRVHIGIGYWNTLAGKTLFVIDNSPDATVQYRNGPWSALGPDPTTGKWVISHPAKSRGDWRVEAHEAGHILFGNFHATGRCPRGVMGNPCTWGSDANADRKLLVEHGYAS